MPIAFTEAQRQQAIALHARWETANTIRRHDFVTVDDRDFPDAPGLVVAAFGRGASLSMRGGPVVWVRWSPDFPPARFKMDSVSKVEVPDALVPVWAAERRRQGTDLQVTAPVQETPVEPVQETPVEPVQETPVEPVEVAVGDRVMFDGGEGTIFWKGETRYGALRVGVRTSNRRRGRGWVDVEWLDIEDVTLAP